VNSAMDATTLTNRVLEVMGTPRGRSSHDVASALGRVITGGELAPGTRLPTVRSLARAMGVSPTTISATWNQLIRAGLLTTKGRNGTFVASGRSLPRARRYRVVVEMGLGARLDLSTGIPDPELLPDVASVAGRLQRHPLTTSYQDRAVLPDLEELLRDRWPFEPEALTVVDGALDAIDRVTTDVVRFGDRVIVEHPCFPPVLDLLELLGAEAVPVELDEDGVTPASLAAALDQLPVLWHTQPRAQNPTGVSTTPSRLRELAGVIRRHPHGPEVLIVEDDHSGDIASAAPSSLGRHLPSQVVHIQSFSKSHGPDLRLAAVGGVGEVVERLSVRRMLGPGWSSRILQAVLLELLRDEAATERVERARATYQQRRRNVADALRSHDVVTAGRDGINLWVPVTDERTALVSLAAQGIAVAPGSPFGVVNLVQDHLRIKVGLVRDGHDELAALVARASQLSPRIGPSGR
jgi:DNA-binding transcriptional MocR family regulator